MLRAALRLLLTVNNITLKAASAIAIVAIASMVVAILIQVFFRYVIGNALPWPDEFARFCMLWMTGLMAPVAYRQGGFVAIDMFMELLGRRAAAALSLVLLCIALLVLLMGITLGWKHVNSGLMFSSSSLKIPLSLIGMQSIKLKLVYMYSSLWIGLILLTSVNIELIFKSLSELFSDDDDPTLGTDASLPMTGAD